MRVWKTIIVTLALACVPLAAARADDDDLPAKGTPYAQARAVLLKRGMVTTSDPDPQTLTPKERASRIKKGLPVWEDIPPYDPRFRELNCQTDADGPGCTAYFLDKDKAGWRYYVVVSVDPETRTVSDAHYGRDIEGLPPIPPPLAADVPQLKGSYLKARKVLLAQGFKPARNRNHSDITDVYCRDEECNHTFALPELSCSGTGLGRCNMYWISPGRRVLHVQTIGESRAIYFVEWSSWKSLRDEEFTK